MDATAKGTVETARAEVIRMRAAVVGGDAAAKVSMTLDQFATLANLIEALSDLADRPDPAGFGEARYWVPLDRFVKLRESARSLDRQCSALREAIHRPEFAGSPTFGGL